MKLKEVDEDQDENTYDDASKNIRYVTAPNLYSNPCENYRDIFARLLRSYEIIWDIPRPEFCPSLMATFVRGHFDTLSIKGTQISTMSGSLCCRNVLAISVLFYPMILSSFATFLVRPSFSVRNSKLLMLNTRAGASFTTLM
jgi:hypothetical protein